MEILSMFVWSTSRWLEYNFLEKKNLTNHCKWGRWESVLMETLEKLAFNALNKDEIVCWRKRQIEYWHPSYRSQSPKCITFYFSWTMNISCYFINTMFPIGSDMNKIRGHIREIKSYLVNFGCIHREYNYFKSNLTRNSSRIFWIDFLAHALRTDYSSRAETVKLSTFAGIIFSCEFFTVTICGLNFTANLAHDCSHSICQIFDYLLTFLQTGYAIDQ